MRHILLIVLIVAAAYAVMISGNFVLDDYNVIINNSFVKNWRNFPLIFSRGYLTSFEDIGVNQGTYGIGSGETTYRPVATVSYFINYTIFGLRPWGYRLTNLSLHIINAVLAYLLLNLLLGNRRLSFFAAALFGIHPVNAEVVNCTGYRPNLLVFLFGILSLILYFKFNSRGEKERKFIYLIFSLASFLLALFSKEIGIVLPFALILCDLYYRDFNLKKVRLNLRWYVCYFLAGLFYVCVYFLLVPPRQEIFKFTALADSLPRMLTVLGVYLKEIILPANPVYILPTPLKNSYFMAGLALAAILLGIYSVKKMKAWKAASFGVIWFFVWLLPLNNFLNSFRVVMANRFLYAPVLGFTLLLGAFLTKVSEGRAKISLNIPVLRYMLPFALFGYFFIFSVSANFLWRNELLLSQAVVEKYPSSSLAHLERGRALIMKGDYGRAEDEIMTALSLKQWLKGRYVYDLARADVFLGIIYTQRKEYAQAEKAYVAAATLLPNAAVVRTQLGILYDFAGLSQQALQQLDAAKKLNPGYIPAYIESARVYIGLKDYARAEAEFLKTLEMDPTSQEAKAGLRQIKSVMKGREE